MIDRADSIDWIISPNETEALLLEDMLIKRHHPDFNIRFRDDKRYPILRLDIQDAFPTLTVVRRFENDGALYFGPYTSSRTMRTILRVTERYFPLRRCKGPINPGRRECLNFQIRKCPGVCSGHVSSDTYRQTVNQVELLLSGRNDELVLKLEQEMQQFSESMNFEAAAIRRDQLEAVRNVSGGRKLLLPRPVDLDVFCFDSTSDTAYGELLVVRSGMISGNLHLNLQLDQPLPIEKIADHFMIHYYRDHPPIPMAIISSALPESKNAIETLLKQICGRVVKIYSKPHGIRNKLIALARSNLRIYSQTHQQMKHHDEGLEALRILLNLKRIPHRIEAVDISESQGKHVVGSIVSFLNGKPEKSRYRRYRIRSEDASSDLERIQEILRRRLGRRSSSGWNLPDVFLIDGGRLQLNAALEVFSESGQTDSLVISIAKIRNSRIAEGLFLKDGREISLKSEHVATRFLDRIRDEAHRFAIDYHRLIRDRALLRSRLTDIPGIGSKRRKILLETFRSLDGIRSADINALAKLPGFGIQLAASVKEAIEAFFYEKTGKNTKKSSKGTPP